MIAHSKHNYGMHLSIKICGIRLTARIDGVGGRPRGPRLDRSEIDGGSVSHGGERSRCYSRSRRVLLPMFGCSRIGRSIGDARISKSDGGSTIKEGGADERAGGARLKRACVSLLASPLRGRGCCRDDGVA
ncbi:cytochrome c class I [Striga asiatica]|uniref:Cytochrome c class I n=1 Tax=Striga asiatica TaxID=4170 RepID=A0A5A7RAZ3_STRAF|nr:cytochrome c class I [Striga asiatica]